VWLAAKRAPGSLLDANALGIVSATWSPVLAGFLASISDARRAPGATARSGASSSWAPRQLLPWLIIVVGCLAVFASGSRTAFAAFGVACTFFAAAVATRRQLVTIATGAAVFLLLLGAGARLGVLRTNTPVDRLAATLPSPTVAGVQAFVRSMWVRDGWGQASVAAIVDHPVTGVGLGTFAPQSVDYAYRLTARLFAPDNAQNWWRQQVAELGLAGLLFAGALTVLVVRLLARRAPPPLRAAAAGVRGALAGLAVASLFGVPTQVPVVAFSAWTFLFLAAYLLDRHDPDTGVSRTRRVQTAVVGLFVAAVALGQLHSGTHDLRPPMRVMKGGGSYGYGFWRGGTDEEGQPFWWTGRHSVFVFPLEPGILEFIATPMHPDIVSHPVTVEIGLDGRTILEEVVGDHTPVRLRLPARAGEKAVFVETRVSRTFAGPDGEPRGLRIQKTYRPVAR
jgi:hypothetical protein